MGTTLLLSGWLPLGLGFPASRLAAGYGGGLRRMGLSGSAATLCDNAVSSEAVPSGRMEGGSEALMGQHL